MTDLKSESASDHVFLMYVSVLFGDNSNTFIPIYFHYIIHSFLPWQATTKQHLWSNFLLQNSKHNNTNTIKLIEIYWFWVSVLVILRHLWIQVNLFLLRLPIYLITKPSYLLLYMSAKFEYNYKFIIFKFILIPRVSLKGNPLWHNGKI